MTPRFVANPTTLTAVNIANCLLIRIEASGQQWVVNAYETTTSAPLQLFGPDTKGNCANWLRSAMPDVISGI